VGTRSGGHEGVGTGEGQEGGGRVWGERERKGERGRARLGYLSSGPRVPSYATAGHLYYDLLILAIERKTATTECSVYI